MNEECWSVWWKCACARCPPTENRCRFVSFSDVLVGLRSAIVLRAHEPYADQLHLLPYNGVKCSLL